MTSVLWHRTAKQSLKTSAESASGELMGVQKLFTFPEKKVEASRSKPARETFRHLTNINSVAYERKDVL